MTTRLQKPLAREIDHDGTLYKVLVAPDGLRISRKGTRSGVQVSWDDILAVHETGPRLPPTAQAAAPDRRESPKRPDLGMSDVVAADVLLLMRQAKETLDQASTLIDNASELPSTLASHREPPPPGERERSDWFIEPLLSLRDVSKLLGVSTRRVRGLPLRAVNLDGDVRYQPAEIRRFLATASVHDRARRV